MGFQGTPLTRAVDRLRILVGDISTSTATELLPDVAYDYYLSVSGDDFAAAAMAAQSLAAQQVAQTGEWTEKQVGDLRLRRGQNGQTASGYTQMAKRFTLLSGTQTRPYAGGISRSEKQVDRTDIDKVQPFFRRKGWDYPDVNVDSPGISGNTGSTTNLA